MTLQDFFNYIQANPMTIVYYFGLIMLLTFMATQFSKNESYDDPWRYLYSAIIYAVSIPGIFAVTLNIYFFLFERRSIMQANLLIQVLPIIAMIATILLIKRYISLEYVPGFNRISGLMTIIAVILSLLWIIDRTHIFVISIIPFYYIILFIVTAILLLRYSFSKLAS